eukprot:SAG11_NODE_1060_length_6001_cov_2.264317_1_plen_181_part_00
MPVHQPRYGHLAPEGLAYGLARAGALIGGRDSTILEDNVREEILRLIDIARQTPAPDESLRTELDALQVPTRCLLQLLCLRAGENGGVDTIKQHGGAARERDSVRSRLTRCELDDAAFERGWPFDITALEQHVSTPLRCPERACGVTIPPAGESGEVPMLLATVKYFADPTYPLSGWPGC